MTSQFIETLRTLAEGDTAVTTLNAKCVVRAEEDSLRLGVSIPHRKTGVITTNLPDDVLLRLWRSVQGPHAELTGPLIRFAGMVYRECTRPPEATPSCAWNQDDEGGDSIWETTCKHAFYFDGADGPDDAVFRTCPFCGKPLAEHRTSDVDSVLWGDGND